MARRLLLLLGAAALCLAASGQDAKTLPEKDGILQLSKANFHIALKTYKQLLVHFCKLLNAVLLFRLDEVTSSELLADCRLCICFGSLGPPCPVLKLCKRANAS